MKTIFISLLAIATSIGSNANPSSQTYCQVNGPALNGVVIAAKSTNPQASTSTVIKSSSESYTTKLAGIENAHENQKGYLNFQQTMFSALNQLETEKHLEAVEDLKGTKGYSTLMNRILLEIEAGNLADVTEDAKAADNYNRMMEKALLATPEF